MRNVAEPYFIEDDTSDDELLWRNVDAVLSDGVAVRLQTPFLENLGRSVGQFADGKYWLAVRPSKLNRSHKLLRCTDVVVSSLALLILSPFLMVFAILVKLSSPGPVFYRTIVVGKGGSQFLWRKFRSMKVVPEDQDVESRREKFRAYVEGRQASETSKGPGKIIDSSRVTSIGSFIRKYSIDELPQLWNVFCGQMSLVGPRPCLPYEAEFFTGWRNKRFEVKPGLTGIWQVFGRGRANFNELAAMDVLYTYRRSFWFDLYVIVKTVGVVFTGKGAR